MTFLNRAESTNKKKSFSQIVLPIFIVFISLLLSFFAGAYYSEKNKTLEQIAKGSNVYLGEVSGKYNTDSNGELSQNIDFNLYWNLWDSLKSIYVDSGKITDKELFYGSLRGMADALNDPYTVFLDPKETKKFNEDLSGTFEGIGAEIGIREKVLTIVAPLSGMPAEKAGLKSGDKIFAINGSSTVAMTTDEAVNLIRGQKGTQVKLTIYREGFNETKDFEITREVIYVKSVKAELRDDGVYVVSISSFNEDTSKLFKEVAQDIVSKNPKGIILDLRNNPGGFLEAAVDMTSEWVESGKVVVSEKFGDGHLEEYNSRGNAQLNNYKTIVLVNGGSASASEIVSGALKDYGLAVLVGEKTYGKGSVQSLEDLNDGSTLKITIAKWLTPNGNSINDQGITPDVEIELTSDDYNNDNDPQMKKATELLLGK